MKALLDLFKQVQQDEQFDAIKIGLASPRKNQVLVLRRSKETGNNQLSYLQTGT